MIFNLLLITLICVSVTNGSQSPVQQPMKPKGQNLARRKNHAHKHAHKPPTSTCPSTKSLKRNSDGIAAGGFRSGTSYTNSSGICDPSVYDCWMRRINDPAHCITLEYEFPGKPASLTACTQDSSGKYLCATNFDELKRGANCRLKMPDSFVINWIAPLCYLGGDRPCNAINGGPLASCDGVDLFI